MGRTIENIDVSAMLISPPPEEILRPSSKHPSHGRSASTHSQSGLIPSSLLSTPVNSSKRKPSKRKRFISSPAPNPSAPSSNVATTNAIVIDGRAQTVEATPNPKPRKQTKRHSHNLLNDCNLPSSHRRSATPIPAYEPPREHFTPPREVFVTPLVLSAPRVSKSSKRKPVVKDLKLVVKTEPPDVSLLPLPPPSPTDDPLLLSGPLKRPFGRSGSSYNKSRMNNQILPRPLFHDKNPQSFAHDSRSLTSMSPVEVFPLDTSASRVTSTVLNTPDDAIPLPSFDLDLLPTSNGWSDSDSDSDSDASEFNQSGEYTGRFMIMKVPTKLDSPPGGMRGRVVSRSRPASPFPGNKRKGAIVIPRVGEEESEDEEMESETIDIVQDQGDEEVRNSRHKPGEQSLNETSPNDLRPTDLHDTSLAVVDDDDHSAAAETYLTGGKERDILSDSPHVERQEFCLRRDASVDLFYVGQLPELAEDLGTRSRSTSEQDFGLMSAESHDNGPHRNPVSPLPHCTALTSTNQYMDDAISGSDDDGSDSDDNSVEINLVKISSDDPRAAARAAAILKQHDYDCFTRTSMKRRHSSHITLDSVSRNARRKNVSKSGIIKTTQIGSSQKQRRATLGGVIGDQVFIPGSPVTSLPELLKEAEVGLDQTTSNLPIARNPFETPSPAPPKCIVSGIGEWHQYSFANSTNPITREWTRDDWKLLDTCFTEERLNVGQELELGDDVLADVNDIRIEDVVTRFTRVIGGTEVVDVLGPEWSFDRLSTRVSALQKRQRSGSLAPSSPQKPLPTATPLTCSADVPDFTPLPRRLPPSRPIFPPAVTDSPFNELLLDKHTLHPSPEAPNHFEEATSTNDSANERPLEIQSAALTTVPPSTSKQTTHEEQPKVIAQAPPTSIGKRMKGFLFSYLPSLSKSVTPPQQPPISRPGLPLPPREVLEKPRGHISTPVRPLAPKPIPPKELVHLQPAPAPQVSMIPRASKPQRLVNLRPVSPQINTGPIPISRPRKSSGGSVKDLIKNFEERQAISRKGLKSESKRVRSIDDFRRKCLESRPAWRV